MRICKKTKMCADLVIKICNYAEMVKNRKDNLDNWAHIAHGMKKSVSEYDPEGTVKCMDVFYAVPMPGYGPADTVENWFDGYISKWDAFVEGGAEYHLVEGSHKTMINSPYVEVFQERLNMILEERGL